MEAIRKRLTNQQIGFKVNNLREETGIYPTAQAVLANYQKNQLNRSFSEINDNLLERPIENYRNDDLNKDLGHKRPINFSFNLTPIFNTKKSKQNLFRKDYQHIETENTGILDLNNQSTEKAPLRIEKKRLIINKSENTVNNDCKEISFPYLIKNSWVFQLCFSSALISMIFGILIFIRYWTREHSLKDCRKNLFEKEK